MASSPAEHALHTRISFEQFASYCQHYISHRNAALHSQHAPLSWLTYSRGWEWLPPVCPGPAFQASACLSRCFPLLFSPALPHTQHDDIDDDIDLVGDTTLDEAQECPDPLQSFTVTVTQTISYSKSWLLPILSFHATTPSGEPIPLQTLTNTPLFHNPAALSTQEHNHFHTHISVADHPRTGLPTYFLHPCHTNTALSTLLSQAPTQTQPAGWTYIASFISLCASVVEMRAPA